MLYIYIASCMQAHHACMVQLTFLTPIPYITAVTMHAGNVSDTSDSDQSYIGDGPIAGLTHETASQTETTSDSHEKSGKRY